MTKASKYFTPLGGSMPNNFEGCILLSVAHPGRAAGLAAFAAALAAAQRRPVLVLNVQRVGGTLSIQATVRSVQLIPEQDIAALQQELANRLNRPVALNLTVLPAIDLPAVAPSTYADPNSNDAR
jgi:hypothetical protein